MTAPALAANYATFTDRNGRKVTIRVDPEPPIVIHHDGGSARYSRHQAATLLDLLDAPREVKTWLGPPF